MEPAIVPVVISLKQTYWLYAKVVDALNTLRGFPNGFPLTMRQADCEAADPGGLNAQLEVTYNAGRLFRGELLVFADGSVKLRVP